MDALAYLHYGPEPDDHVFSKKYWNQIYYRDPKPANVFLKRDNQKKEIVAKLADFGCAISDQFTKLNRDRSYASMTSAHTPGFDPPEHPDFSVVTDVWQLALCIVCVCTRTYDPRSKSHPTGVEWDKKQPAGQQYTRELNEVLRWCLTVDLKRRPNSWEVLKRLRDKYSKVKDSLPYNEWRMDMFWKPRIDIPPSKAQHPAFSPGPRAVDPQQGFQERHPSLSSHTNSDPGVERTEHMGNRYTDMVRNQRRAMSPNSIDNIISGGGGYGQSETPGRYGQPGLPAGYGQPGVPGGFVPGFHRGFGRGGGTGGYFDPRSGPGWT
jgi:serine/threonine protein kinase